MVRTHLLASVCAMLAAVTTTSAATIYSDGEFNNLVQDGSFTAGTDASNTLYHNGGPDVGRQATGGNPGAYLNIGKYESTAILALDAPAGGDTWDISFDLASTNQYSNFFIRVFGLTHGQDVNRGYSGDGSTTAVTLATGPDRSGTQGAWTSYVLEDVVIPAGFDDIAIKFYANFESPSPHGIDNLLVTGTDVQVPEPATLGLIGVGALGLLARRRRAAV